MRVLLGAFGDPGHAFPVLALGAELVARGHDVGIETWAKWREPAEAAGMTFSAALRSRRISPPKKRSGESRPRMTFASVTVGSVPPRP